MPSFEFSQRFMKSQRRANKISSAERRKRATWLDRPSPVNSWWANQDYHYFYEQALAYTKVKNYCLARYTLGMCGSMRRTARGMIPE